MHAHGYNVVVLRDSSSEPSPDAILWFREWKAVFAWHGLLYVNQPICLDISHDEEVPIVAEESIGDIANSFGALEEE